ncbi:MAG: acyl-CoA dehydrogenase family protein [Reyranella sp.]|nr:acyl-CoA dehydrogenase family protein [Reyranella sp.]
MTSFGELSREWRPIRGKVEAFIEERVYPLEQQLDDVDNERYFALMRPLMAEAKARGIWALGHPKEIGGQGLPFAAYVLINEVIGRSEHAIVALGTHTLQDALMLHRFAGDAWKEKYLRPLVDGEFFPSVSMTEPAVASSDPTQLQTKAVLEDGVWRISGRKWFTTWANRAAFSTVFARTESEETPAHKAFSMIVVPTDAPGYRIVREIPVFGMHGCHCEVALEDVRVPADNIVGGRGEGFAIAQKRLGPGRIYHCMRWLGQAQRAFDLMCRRANERVAFGGPLASKQLVQKMVFDSASEIQACRLLTLDAARKIDAGEEARTEIALIKVVGAQMVHNVVDRAIQVHGAMGVTIDTPLERMYRHARFARIYDGPDEVHIESVAKRILRTYAQGGDWDFAERDQAAPPAARAAA